MAGAADAENLYHDALRHLRRTPFRTELARAHLLYGEWLRREKEWHLRKVFTKLGIRSRRELASAFPRSESESAPA